MASEPNLAAAVTPGAPRWGLSVLYAALLTLAICWPMWPGMMSFDSLYAYEESLHGIETMTWPPMHAYLFWLSRHLGAGAGGVFALQTFLLFLAAALFVHLMIASRAWAAAALGAFALSFVYVPELLGSAIVQWRDVTTASFALAGFAAWLRAAKQRSRVWLALAAACLGVAAALRYNAVLLFVLVCPLMVWRPFLAPRAPHRTQALAAVALLASLGLAWASTHWRLPDFKAMPATSSFVGAQQFDLIGISACADRNYLPPRMTAGWPITPRQIRQAYDPRHLQLAYRAYPGAPRIQETDAGGRVQKIWPLVVRHQFGCYLAHRTAVFVQQMGLARRDVFYPTEFGIIANPYGLKPAHPQAVAKLYGYINTRAPELWRRPILLYVLAVLGTGAVWVCQPAARLLFAALLGGALAYPAALFVAAPAADARYIFPSNVLCALLTVAAAGIVMSDRRGRGAPD